MGKLLIEMIDGGIVNIEQDNWNSHGCETCDFGSSYVNELTVYLTKHKIITRIDKMYDYLLSDGDLFKIFIGGLDEIKEMTEEEFIKWLELKIKELGNSADVEYDHVKIEFNKED